MALNPSFLSSIFMRATRGSDRGSAFTRRKTSCCSIFGGFFSSSTRQMAKQASGAISDRHFVNDMPDFVGEKEDGGQEEAKTGKEDSLKRLLFLPYDKASLKFLQAGVEIKDRVRTPSLSQLS